MDGRGQRGNREPVLLGQVGRKQRPSAYPRADVADLLDAGRLARWTGGWATAPPQDSKNASYRVGFAICAAVNTASLIAIVFATR